MEAFVTKPMLKKLYELYRTHQIDDNGLANAIEKKWCTVGEAAEIKKAVKAQEDKE